MQKRNNKKIAIFVLLFILALIVQRWMETQNIADSIGWWYTIFCAIIYSGVIFGAFVGFGYLIKGK